MQNKRLFPNSVRSDQQRRKQQESQKILEQIERIARNPDGRTMAALRQKSIELSRVAGSSSSNGRRDSGGFGDKLLQVVRGIERIATDRQRGVLDKILAAVGTPGHLISSWLRGSEGQQVLRPIQDEVRRGLDLIGQLQAELRPSSGAPMTPEAAGGRRIADRPDDGAAVSAGGGRSQTPPPRTPSGSGSGSGSSDDDDPNRPHPNVRILPDGRWRIRGPGYLRILPANHPALDGRMVPVQSSNVYSIGYEFNFDQPLRGSLIVRYLQKNRRGEGRVPGPTYEYLRVHPDFFDELWKASSKGKWIWDEVRIRGTIAGHQYSYNLTRAAQGYLPRRAGVVNGRQVLQRRKRTAEYRSGRTEVLVSPLASRDVGPYRPAAHRPNVGNPNRGTPNRGR